MQIVDKNIRRHPTIKEQTTLKKVSTAEEENQTQERISIKGDKTS